jgi:thymidylate synthase (FAD)
MPVKLVSITTPLIDGVEDMQDLIAYCARVSNPTNQLNSATSSKLLKYLMDNKHWSPFEMVSVTFEICTTRDIARQILRHRSFKFQEFSQRYAEISSIDEGFTPREARMQHPTNRQSSVPCEDADVAKTWKRLQHYLYLQAQNTYNWAIENGLAKECARVVLPEGLTPSRMYMTGDLRCFITYCQTRIGNGTQKEHSEIAQQIADKLSELFPAIDFTTQ